MPIWLFGCKRCVWHAATDVKQLFRKGKGHAMKFSHASGHEVAKTLKFGALFWYIKAQVSQNSTEACRDTQGQATQSQPCRGGMNPSCGEVGYKNTDLTKVIQ